MWLGRVSLTPALAEFPALEVAVSWPLAQPVVWSVTPVRRTARSPRITVFFTVFD